MWAKEDFAGKIVEVIGFDAIEKMFLIVYNGAHQIEFGLKVSSLKKLRILFYLVLDALINNTSSDQACSSPMPPHSGISIARTKSKFDALMIGQKPLFRIVVGLVFLQKKLVAEGKVKKSRTRTSNLSVRHL